MAEEPVAESRQAIDAHDQDPEHHQRTLTDLIDEIEREAFSRSLAKRSPDPRRHAARSDIED
jgi:hypothetical protein